MKELFQESLNAQSNKLLNEIWTAIPCVVLGVIDSLNGAMVNIQPSINQRTKDGTVKERTPILGVPVVFPCSRTSAFTFPIQAGDTGLAIFSMRNLDAWKNSQGFPSAPLNFAKFDKGDAIFVPGLQPSSISVNNPSSRFWHHNTKDTVVAHNIGTANEVEMRMTPEGNFLIKTNADVQLQAENVAVSASYMSVEVADTEWVGNITHAGVLNSNGIVFDSHVHTGVQSGPSTTGGPQ